jgi:large subunit ribosomal protein L21
MYAVVRSGNKQYRVEPGQRVRVERMAGAVGDTVELGEVLMLGGEGNATIGKPLVAGAKAVGKIVDQGRGPKLLLFKMKRRKNYRRKQGHRQDFTEILVDRIES